MAAENRNKPNSDNSLGVPLAKKLGITFSVCCTAAYRKGDTIVNTGTILTFPIFVFSEILD